MVPGLRLMVETFCTDPCAKMAGGWWLVVGGLVGWKLAGWLARWLANA